MQHKVNIYTYTNIRGLRKKDGVAWYILETMTSKGEASVGDKLQLEQCTGNQAQLTVLLEAVRRLKEALEVHVYTESSFVAAGWRSGWIEGWKKTEWMTQKGEPVAYREMWQELEERLRVHNVIFHVKESHPYSGWFAFEEEKAKEK